MIARLAGLTPELPASGRVPPQAWDRWKWRSRNASWESLSDRARWSAERPAYFSQALMAAHTEASRAAIRGYIGEPRRVWEVISPCVQNILLRAYLTSFLGFFTGFSLNNAFQRFSRGLDHVQQLSVHLRTGTDLVLSLLAGSGEPGTPNIDRNAEEVVSWTKVYFIQACRGLHSVTLRTKRSKLDRAMEQWETFLSEQVVLSAACVSAVAAHSDVFVSTLQMELLWWRWLAPVLGSCPVDVQPSRKSFDAARSSFHAAHLLASGMTFPITMRLLEVIMYLFCLCHPWLTVQAFGAWSFLPTLFVTWLFFSAHRMSIDLWEPYGVKSGRRGRRALRARPDPLRAAGQHAEPLGRRPLRAAGPDGGGALQANPQPLRRHRGVAAPRLTRRLLPAASSQSARAVLAGARARRTARGAVARRPLAAAAAVARRPFGGPSGGAGEQRQHQE
ncbi:unnamed protein product [Prorocentrum cordatum]|uniref:Uncharacterized protein n=1 Tax=Prorocentrum cordatum TaxID=2364126 RepID=A0ABN9SAE2_9DINO|nr:unnamed protein product [Polarella glacialis]